MAVIQWAAIFRTPSSMFDKMLHLSKSESFAMSGSRSCNLREAIGNLLTVTMYLQDSLSRFHRPGLHKIDFHVHVASASHESELLNCPCTGTIVPGEQLHILVRQNVRQTMFCFLEDALQFQRRSLTSPAKSASVFTTEPCGVPRIPGTSRLQPTIVLHAGYPTKISQQTLDASVITRWQFCRREWAMNKLHS